MLIDDEALIKTIKFAQKTYVGDPVNAIKILALVTMYRFHFFVMLRD